MQVVGKKYENANRIDLFIWHLRVPKVIIYFEKATKVCEIFPLLLTVYTEVKSKGKISQNFVAFSKYMNFKNDDEELCFLK